MTRTFLFILSLCFCFFLIGCKPKAGINGRITDAHGDPLKGIIVSLDDDKVGPPIYYQTRSDADGRYHFSSHDTDSYILTILWDQNPNCPEMTINGDSKLMQFFHTDYKLWDGTKVFMAVQIFHYMKGETRQMDLQIPCIATKSSKS